MGAHRIVPHSLLPPQSPNEIHQSTTPTPPQTLLEQYIGPPTKRNFTTTTMSKGDWRTTSAEQLSQIHLKKDYEVKDVSKLINEDNIDTLNVERHTGHPEHGFGAVLPHHNKEHGKMNLETTYCTDYTSPYHYSPPLTPEPVSNQSQQCREIRSPAHTAAVADWQKTGDRAGGSKPLLWGRSLDAELIRRASPELQRLGSINDGLPGPLAKPTSHRRLPR
ncbi:Hypothetical predicted protein [Pelobates cultripes]|uniref:Uncharacterized protein n=1 Tax=Pelobates cultripes TaxID=61616 RepID=A0AAD1S788_PELCU|nr:Hypothetical predicted protein [Pelobates cultripes]